MNYRLLATACALVAFAAPFTRPAHAQADAAPLLTKSATITLPGTPGGGDYMTVADGFLYVANSAQGTMSVVDVKTNAVVATILGVPRCHGFAAVPKEGKGFISVGGNNTVAVIDLKTNKVVKSIPVGSGPDGIIFAPKNDLVYVANHKGGTASLIDPKTLTVVGEITLKGTAEFAREDPRTGAIYQNIEDSNEVLTVNVKDRKVTRRVSTLPAEGPTGLAFDLRTDSLLAACGNSKLVVIDALTGKIKSTLPIGEGTDFAEYDPANRRAYTADGSGSVTIIQGDGRGYHVAGTVKTEKGAHTLALDGKTHRVYVLRMGVVTVYDAAR